MKYLFLLQSKKKDINPFLFSVKRFGKLGLLPFFYFITFFSFSQEICDNGIDDDGDGLIDCYDSECSLNDDCNGFFFGNTVNCSDEIRVSTFALKEQWSSASQTATSHALPIVGDLDGDGIPEVISINNLGTTNLSVLDGSSGTTLASRNLDFIPGNAPVIADVNSDGIADIFISENKGNLVNRLIYNSFRSEIVSSWKRSASLPQAIGLIGIADFDEDGDSEIYYRNEIMDAETGNIIVSGSGDWVQDYVHGPIAVDILGDDICPDCGGLELITGNEIWAINEANGTRTVIKNMNDVIHANIDPNLNYYPKYYSSWDGQWSSVSVADYNLDGNLDVLMSGALGSTTDTYNGATTVFFWDVANSNIITYQDPGNNFERGTGRINIGDVDGDGNLNATFVMNQRLYSLDEEFNVHWIHPIMEGSSGFSGCSIFDFDGDGAYEIIYRSEESLVIIDGIGNGDNTTSIKSQIACVSNTQEEYPVIADVDGDGRSEICVSCFVNDALPNSPYSNTQFSQIRLFESNGEAWMPARHVWNQHGYFNVNINDNLTVPIEIQNHATIFSENICEYNDGTIIPHPSRPLNTFMNQGSLHNTDGCVEFISSDIEFIGIISASDASCPSAAITVTFQITNIGEINISGNLPISYYAGDPRSNNSMLLDTETTFLRNFLIGQTVTISQDINGIGGNYNLYVVINDNGQTPPIPTPLPTGPVPECNTENNIRSIQIGYEPFSIIVEKVKDNQKCATNVLDNGIARAYYSGSSMTQNYSHWLEDFENLPADAAIDEGETAWTYIAGFSGGANQISSLRGSNQFIAKGTSIDNTDLLDALWTSEDIDVSNLINISISVDISETGNLESTGADADYIVATYSLRDVNGIITESGVLNNGNLVGDFIFEQATINNLNQNRTASTLSIVILFHNQDEEIYALDNISVEGTLLNVPTELTEQDGYIFNWYNPNDTLYINPVYTGSRYPQMAQGLYSVIGYYEMTECYSDTAQIRIDLSTTPAFNVRIVETSSLTNCTNPNGGLEAFAYTQIDANGNPIDTLRTVDGYTFTWFIQTEGSTPIGTGNSIQNLDAIGYTVEVLNTLSGCVVSESESVSSNLTLPVTFTAKTNNITSCGGMGLLSIEPLIGNVNINDYIFKWYSGADVTPTPDAIGQSYSVSSIGLYTLVYELTSSGCSSESITVEIREEIENGLTPNVFTVLNNTSCVSSNGSAIAYGNNIVDVASYGYRWFVGNNVLNANLLPQAIPSSFFVNGNPNEIGGLPAGVYTVEINNPQNNCNTIRSIQIVDETMPRITLDLTGITVMNTLGNFCVENQTGIISSGRSALRSNDGSAININRISLGNINGDFEIPDIPTSTDQDRQFRGGAIKWYNQAFILGWNTTASDGIIEIWHKDNSSGGISIPPFSGNQFAEINASQEATLYFDLATTPGLLLDWSFAHRARDGSGILYDTIAVNIGPPNTTIRQGVFAATNSDWVINQGTYTVPNGQVTTRFAFQAVSTTGNNNTVGNFIDNVSFVLRPFRFELYTGNQASGTPIAVNTSGTFNDINVGNYTLALIDNITGCLQSTALINVPALEGMVTMESAMIQDDYCGIGGNGSITINALNSVGFTSTSYAYELYSGHTLNSASQIVNDSLNSSHPDFPLYTFSALSAGDYRVRIYPKANNIQACDVIMDFTINEEIIIPVITNPVINDNTSCIATSSNGFVSVEIENDQEENYFFTWYAGTNTTGTVISPSKLGGNTSRGNTITGLSSGNYTVVAKNSSTNCESLPFTLAISENPYNPNILITEMSPQTNCSIGNGVLRASIQNSPDVPTPTTLGFSFQWQLNGVNLVDGDTASNGSIPVGAQNYSISGLISGEYTLVATHTISNCSSTENFVLSNNPIIPSIALNGPISGNNFLSCLLGTGAAAVTVSPTGIYDYEWYDSDGTRLTDTRGIRGSNTSNISGLIHDTYRVVAVSPLSCESNSLIIRVPDTRMALNPRSLIITPNSICDTAANDSARPDANGSISIELNSGGTTYNFTVLLGGRKIAADGTTTGFEHVNYDTTGITSINITGLPTGLYQIQIFDNISQCVFDNLSLSIQDIGQDFSIDTTTINDNTVDNTSCDSTAFTGTATVNLADITSDLTASLTDYGFSWTTAADLTTVIDDDNILDDDINGNSGVQDGDYVLTVTNLITGCVSPNATISINSNQPTLVAGESDLTGNSACDTLTNANGQVTFTPTGGNGTFAFSLQTANGMNIAADSTTFGFENVGYDTTGVITTNVTGIPTGNYRMTIIHEETGCAIEHPFTIQNISQALTINTANINTNTVNNTSCDSTDFTGTATVSIADITADPTASLADYGFSWTTAADLTTVIDDDNILDDDINGNSGVQDGDYVLTVTNLITGCVSPNATISINSNQPTLVAGESDLTGNSACDTLTNANGQVTFTPTGGNGTFAFSLQTANGMNIAADGTTTGFDNVNYDTTGVITTNVTGIPTGNYRMTIIHEETRCAIVHPFTIQNISRALTIDTANINTNTVNNTSCDSTDFTGTATVSLADITSDPTASLTDYGFSWTTAADLTTIIDDDNILDDDINGNSGVQDGDYVLTVTNLITGCVSPNATISINSSQPTLVAGESNLTGNSVCDPLTNSPTNPDANGQVTFTPTGGNGTFVFSLQTANGMNIAADGTTTGFENVGYDTTEVITTDVTGIPTGNYRMTIIHKETRCAIVHPFTIQDTSRALTINTANINTNTVDNTSCDSTDFTGTATVSLADITADPTASLTDYGFSWTTAIDPATVIDNDNILDDDINGNSGVQDGDYVLTVTNLITGCVSPNATISINSDQPTLVAGESNLMGNSVCDTLTNANGQVTFTPTGGNGTFAFSLQTANGMNIAADSTTVGFENVGYDTTGVMTTNVTGIPTGNYRMTIIHEETRCAIEHPFTIQDISQALTINTANINTNTMDNGSCDSTTFTGTATVSLADITADPTASLTDYGFSWTTAIDPATVIDNDETLDGVQDGDYVLTVTNLITGCVSPNATISINSSQPTLVAGESNLTGNSVCDPLTNSPTNPDANGQVTFTPTGGIRTFAFSLQTANGMNIAADGTTTGFENVNYDTTGVMTTDVTGIPTGNYRMTIIHEETRCAIVHPFTIQDTSRALTINTANINTNTVNNTSCDSTDFTGTATVSLADITSDLTDSLAGYGFSWTTAADLTTVIDNDNILDDDINGNSGVQDGDYVLTVTNLITGCVSPNATISINSSQPTLVAGESNLTGNSVCDPLTNSPTNPDANGQVTFTPTGGNGTFVFSLQTANGMNIAADSTTSGFENVNYDTTGVITTNVTGIPTGNYRMTIINEVTRCAIVHPFTIQNISQALTIDTANINANIVNNTSCDSTAFTGTATVSIADITADPTASLTDYGFSWTTAIDPATVIDNDNILDDDINGNSGVQDGDYVLTVTNLITGCQSLSVNVTIGQSLPSITPITQVLRDNFSCRAANPIGSATLTINEGPNTNYSFEWYVGSSVAGVPFDTDSLIENRLHGNYTVLITDNATLCTEIARITIEEIMPTITITSTGSNDYSSCYPANGQVSVIANTTFSPTIPIGVDTNFVYQWFFGTSIDPANLLREGVDPGNFSNPTGVTTSRVSGLVAGNYTVLVTDSLTLCSSGVRIVTVMDEVSPYQPTLNFTNVTFPSSCADENGRITAEIMGVNTNGLGAGTNFTFEWYEGAQDFASLDTTGSEAALQTGDPLLRNPGGTTVNVVDNGITGVGGSSTLTQIVSGLYTIVMIDQTTGCRYFETYELGFAGQQITTTLTIDNIVGCDGNGVARVGLADNIILVVTPTNILDTLTIGESFSTSPSGATGTIVLDNRNQLQVTLNTGSSTLTIGDTITETSTGFTAVIDSIRGEGYATGLEQYDDISQYIIYLYSGSGVPADRFTPYTFDGETFPYSYNPLTGEVLDGNSVLIERGDTLMAGDSAIFNQLPAGTYIAIAQEIINPAFNPSATNQCWTAASRNDTILNLAYEPLIQNFSASSNSNCDITNGNGQLSITVIENPNENLINPTLQQPNGYRFVWIKDADSSIVHRDSIFTETATSTTLADLEPGSYTLFIDRLGNQDSTSNNCQISQNLTVGNNPEQHEVISASSTPSTDCNPLSGTIIINDADITDSVANYRFTWYTTFIANDSSGNILLADSLVDSLNNGAIGARALSGLGSGTYFVQATHTNGCVTPAYSIQIDEQRLIPAFNLEELSPNTVCDSLLTPSGIASLTITNGVNPADYIISWFESDGTTPLDTSTTTATFSNNTITVSNLSDGIYFVQIQDTANSIGCLSTLQSVTINQFTPTIFIRGNLPGIDFNITASDNCPPNVNGSFEILNVSESRPDGSTVSILNNDFALADYTFDWFESDGTTALGTSTATATATFNPNRDSVGNLPAGVYFVQITNDSTGCTQPNADFIQFTILDEAVNPTFTFLTSVEDLSCNNTTPTGQANIVITNGSANPTDYIIRWFESDGTTPLDTSTTTATFSNNTTTASNLSDGMYFVQIQDTANSVGCRSALQSVTIDQFIPTIYIGETTPGTDFNITASDNCSPNANGSFEILNVSEFRPNGRIVSIFNGDFTLTNYSFNWFESDGTTPLGTSTATATATFNPNRDSVGNLPAGVYFVQITNDSTGCAQPNADFIQFTILDEAVNPTFTFLTSVEDLSCNNTTPTGQANIVITNGSANPTDYIIRWFESDGTTLLDTATTTATFSNNTTTASNLSDGMYFVQIQDTANSVGCRSALQSVTIDQFIPTIYIGETTPGTDFNITASDNCPPNVNGSFEILNVSESRPNGRIVSIFNGDFTLTNYSFNWFESDGTTPLGTSTATATATFNPNRDSVGNLPAGVYFVQITNDSTGCAQPNADFIQFTILDEAVNPTFTFLTSVDDLSCNNTTPTGQANIVITNGSANPTDYIIRWFESDGTTLLDTATTTATFSNNTTTASNLSDGMYFVQIQDTANSVGCRSALQSVTIDQFIPTIYIGETTPGTDFNITASDNCPPNVNGSFEILNVSESRPNGSFVSIFNGDFTLTNYSFNWFESDGTTPLGTSTATATATFNPNRDSVGNLPAGVYFVQITNDSTGCAQPNADFIQFTILDEAVNPTFTFLTSVDDLSCNNTTPTGQANIVITNGSANPTDYIINWFESDGTTLLDTATTTATFSNNTTTASNLSDGMYFVQIQDTANSVGCRSALQSVTIDQFIPTIYIGETTPGTDFNITASDDCSFNGSFEILNVSESRPDGSFVSIFNLDFALADYTFDWFESDGTTPLNDTLVVGFNNGDASASRVARLMPGVYFVQISNDSTGCAQPTADFIQFTILDSTFVPTFTFLTSVDDFSCNNTTPTGQANIVITNGSANPTDYIINWFENDGTTPLGTSTTTATFNAARDIASNLPEGMYFVQIQDTANSVGCRSALQSVTIDQFMPTIYIGETTPGTDFNITASDDCSFNGSFEILNVSESRPGGSFVSIFNGDFALTNYSFNWFESDGTTPLGTSTATATFNPNRDSVGNLPAGVYFVQITNDSTGCVQPTADIIQFTILNEEVNPTFTFLTMDDLSCNNITPTGQANIVITNGSANPTDYIIRWFESDTMTALGTSTTTATFNAARDTASNLPEGMYFVEIEDTTNSLGCVSALQLVTIDEFMPTISIRNSTDFINTASDDCSFNGSFQILNITESRPGGDSVSITNDDFDLADYSFNWFESDRMTALDTATATFNPNRDSVGNLPAGSYFVQITNDSTGCVQPNADFIPFTILDEAVNPVINLARPVSRNTYCDDGNNQGSGEISISIVDEDLATTTTISDFSIVWYRDSISDSNQIFPIDSGARGTATIDALSTTISNLASGRYTVVVTKDQGDALGVGNENCFASAVYNVISIPDIPTLNQDAIQARTVNDTICGVRGSGSLVIRDSDVSTGDLSDFEIRIYEDSVGGTELLGSPYRNILATEILYDTLSANDYFITAQDTTTRCSATTAIINIRDSTRNPQITLTQLIASESCTSSDSSGSISVLVDNRFDHTNPHLTFLWTDNTSGDNVMTALGIPETEAGITGVPAGIYTVTVTNTNTNCVTSRSYTVIDEPQSSSISDYSIVNNTVCNDNNDPTLINDGIFDILEIIFNSNNFTKAQMGMDYQLNIVTLPDLDPVVDSNPLTPYTFEGLPLGEYRAVINRVTSGCMSNGLDFSILDEIERPLIDIVLQEADSTCSGGGTPNGTLYATVSLGSITGIDHTDPDYTFSWYQGSGIGTPLRDTTSTISGLSSGIYTVQVERISTGCIVMKELELPNETVNFEIQTVATTGFTLCQSANGVINITGINRGNLNDYRFEFYNQDPTDGTPTPIFTVPNDGPIFNTAMGGVYYIIGTDTLTNCATSIFTAEVDDNVSYPVIRLDDFSFQENCSGNNPNGKLSVLAQPENRLYDFKWFYGTDNSNPLTADDLNVGVNLSGASTNTVVGLEAGFYTVEVTSNATGCSALSTYEMSDNISNPIKITTSVSFNTSCVTPNGKIAVSILNRGNPPRPLSDWNYYWFNGNIATVGLNPNPANAIYTGTLIDSLFGGSYVVLVIDRVDNTCRSNVQEIIVEDVSIQPIAYNLTVNHATICSENKNGFASVSTENLSSIHIDWYDFARNNIGNTFFIDSLAAGIYSFELTQVNTGCILSEVFEIQNRAPTPSSPTIFINKGRDNCLNPNGNAVANSGGLSRNFLFEWFDPRDMSTPYATGSEVFNLDTITYLVRATDIATDCESAFTSVEIGNELLDPEYKISISKSLCSRTEDGSANLYSGNAVIDFVEFNRATDYRWILDGEIVGEQSQLIDATPGDYTVFFTAQNGCEYSESFTIGSAITIYNGLSANFDGKNDFLLIDCIDNFPTNNVKIFNRSGQIVFDLDHYNNTSLRFDGQSNVGSSQLRLPAGTYFYVIDLGNNEDNMQGYLELIR